MISTRAQTGVRLGNCCAPAPPSVPSPGGRLRYAALCNGTAHGGLPDQDEAVEHLHVYLPVLHQILDAFRYRMIVAEEGVFDRHEAAHALNLFDMHQKYADVVSLAEVLEYLSAWRARQAWEQPANVK